MSINWHYFRKGAPTITSAKGRMKELAMYAQAANPKDINAFSAMNDDMRKDAKNGRAWRAEELRLKGHDDLHKLWYVMLKEKNKLKSDFLMSKQLGQMYFGRNDLKKVKLSMARLLTIVNERKRLRAQYRIHLEDEYIKKIKEREFNEFLAKRDQMAARGEKNLPMTDEEVKRKLKSLEQGRMTKMTAARDQITESTKDGKSTVAPMLDDADLDFLAQTKVKLTQRDILKMYVGNWSQLDLKQRRKVMGYVQAQRAKHAKQIFIKELSAIGRKMDQATKNGNEEALIAKARVKGKKDPLKLKLEQIGL